MRSRNLLMPLSSSPGLHRGPSTPISRHDRSCLYETMPYFADPECRHRPTAHLRRQQSLVSLTIALRGTLQESFFPVIQPARDRSRCGHLRGHETWSTVGRRHGRRRLRWWPIGDDVPLRVKLAWPDPNPLPPAPPEEKKNTNEGAKKKRETKKRGARNPPPPPPEDNKRRKLWAGQGRALGDFPS